MYFTKINHARKDEFCLLQCWFDNKIKMASKENKKQLIWLKNRFTIIKMITAVVITIGSVAFSIDYIIIFYQKYIAPIGQVIDTNEVTSNQVYTVSTHANKEYLSGKFNSNTSNTGNGLIVFKDKQYTIWKNDIELNLKSAREEYVTILGYIVLPKIGNP